jgi:hypothetical protein
MTFTCSRFSRRSSLVSMPMTMRRFFESCRDIDSHWSNRNQKCCWTLNRAMSLGRPEQRWILSRRANHCILGFLCSWSYLPILETFECSGAMDFPLLSSNASQTKSIYDSICMAY